MIENIKNSPLNLQATSVYNFNEYSLVELLNKFFTTINECVDSSNTSLEFLTWLKGEGLPSETIKELNNMYEDGRLTSVIDELSGNLNNKLEQANSDLNSKIDSEINKIDSHLDEIMIHFSNYTSDKEGFIQACADCINKNRGLYIDKDYVITFNNEEIIIPPLISNFNSILTINGNVTFEVNDNFYIKDLKIKTTNFIPMGTDIGKLALFKTREGKTVNNIYINNFQAIYNDVTNGSQRAKGCFNFSVNNLYVNNVLIEGFRFNYNIENSTNVNLTNITMLNCQNGFVGYQIKGLKVINSKLENTLIQAKNCFRVNGSDMFHVVKSQDIIVDTLSCKYPVERPTYFIDCENVKWSNFLIYECANSGGLKFVGSQDIINDVQSLTLAKNLTIDNVTFTNNGLFTCFNFYNVDNVTIRNINMIGSNTIESSNTCYETFLYIGEYVYNLTLDGIKTEGSFGTNFCRVKIFDVATTEQEDGTVSRHTKNMFKNILLKNIEIKNPVMLNAINPQVIFYVQVNDTIKTNLLNIDDKFINLRFENINVIQEQTTKKENELLYIEPNSKLSSFIYDGNWIKYEGLTFKNIQMKGINNSSGYFSFTDLSYFKNVTLDTENKMNTLSNNYPLGHNIITSNKSNIKLINSINGYGKSITKLQYNQTEGDFLACFNSFGNIETIATIPINTEFTLFRINPNDKSKTKSCIADLYLNNNYIKIRIDINDNNFSLVKIIGDGGDVISNSIEFIDCKLFINYTNKELKVNSNTSDIKLRSTIVF